jgi:hypothetical protein
MDLAGGFLGRESIAHGGRAQHEERAHRLPLRGDLKRAAD